YIFTPLALGVVLSIFASYFFAMTVVPLYCAKFINVHDEEGDHKNKHTGFFARFDRWFNTKFQTMLDWYEGLAQRAMRRPAFTSVVILGGCLVLLVVSFPFLGRAYFPRTDPGQFIINLRMPAGTRLEVSNDYVAKVENIIRHTVKPADMGMIVSNIGVYPDLSAIYTSNASMDTAFIQTSLQRDHTVGSYEYMRRVQRAVARQMPELSAYYQAGGLVDAVINQGLPAPIDIQVKSNDLEKSYDLANQLASKLQAMPDVRNVYIPQSLDYPGLELNIDRERASLVGLSAKDVVDDVITALTSSGMVAPSYWIDPRTGNNYLVTVQYANHWVNHMSMQDLENIPLHAKRNPGYSPLQQGRQAGIVPASLDTTAGGGLVTLGSVAQIHEINTPTEVDHNQIRRVIDVYVAPKSEALQGIGKQVDNLLAHTKHDKNTVLAVRGAVVSMSESFQDFGVGLIIAVLLVYLILMAQFRSFIDPFIILMAIPPGLLGVVLFLIATGSTLNIMSLMGVIMMVGVVVSNSILIVEFSNVLHERGLPLLQATVQSCKVRLRPILMTSLATLLGMIPMALGLEAGSEQYAPLARAIIGGLALSVVVTMFLVPAVYLAIHGRKETKHVAAEEIA
ncbi:MAG TPA: efflux RND transporter permease subunit, partial [Candidatus Saccharimonadales bacterium]|nr:efflux RND transporter permease subunit [Candidatus Saccharimonadales bacterium]